MRLRETGRGHYAIPLFESVHAVPAADCFNSEGAWKRKRDIKHDYNIDQLEQSSHGVEELVEVSRADLVQEAPKKAPIKRIRGYVSPAMGSEGISSEVERMLLEMQMEKVATTW